MHQSLFMKVRSGILLTALFTGSSGASLHLSGRNKAGWVMLLMSWLMLPAILWITITQTSLNISMLRTIFIAAIFSIHLSLLVFHRRAAALKDEKYNTRWSRVFISWLASIIAVYVLIAFIWRGPMIDTSEAQPAYQLSSTEFSQAFNNDETAFRKKYDREVVSVTGIVVSQGMDFSEGDYLALQSAEGSPADVNCYFLAERQTDIVNIVPGEIVTVTGIADGRFLRNCFIEQH